MAEPKAERILAILKTRGPQTAKALAARLCVTAEGARQHLARFRSDGLVEFSDEREEVGRPKRYWRLSEAGHARFPDSHSQLTLELLESVRAEFGEEGLDRLIARRERETLTSYRRRMKGCADVRARVRRLAEIRGEEGYMPEWRKAGRGGFLFVENHCPICAAATSCQGLCRSELEIFTEVLGPDVRVERIDHIVAGARRCAYRISEV